MTVFLIVVSLYGGIELVPMNNMERCQIEAAKFDPGLGQRYAKAYCVENRP